MRGETYGAVNVPPDGVDFNPLSPCGERPLVMLMGLTVSYFNPLPPCGERLDRGIELVLKEYDFNPLSPCGERLPS